TREEPIARARSRGPSRAAPSPMPADEPRGAGAKGAPAMDSIRPHDGTRRRLLARGLAALAIAAGSGCATILYPERKGNTHGRIDVGPLILDILWFIPGIIPGVIA